MTAMHCFYRFVSDDASETLDVWDACDTPCRIPYDVQHPETGAKLQLKAVSQPHPSHLPKVGQPVFVPISETRAAQQIGQTLDTLRADENAYQEVLDEIASLGLTLDAYAAKAAREIVEGRYAELQPATHGLIEQLRARQLPDLDVSVIEVTADVDSRELQHEHYACADGAWLRLSACECRLRLGPVDAQWFEVRVAASDTDDGEPQSLRIYDDSAEVRREFEKARLYLLRAHDSAGRDSLDALRFAIVKLREQRHGREVARA